MRTTLFLVRDDGIGMNERDGSASVPPLAEVKADVLSEPKLAPRVSGAGFRAKHDTEQETAVLNKLVSLLSELEQMLVRIESRKNKQPTFTLQLVLDMINRVAEFSENVISIDRTGNFLTRVLSRAADVYPPAHLLCVEKNRLSAKTVMNLFNSWAGSQVERINLIRQVSFGVIYMLELYFSFFAGSFRSPDVAREWKGVNGVFINHLKKAVDNVRS